MFTYTFLCVQHFAYTHALHTHCTHTHTGSRAVELNSPTYSRSLAHRLPPPPPSLLDVDVVVAHIHCASAISRPHRHRDRHRDRHHRRTCYNTLHHNTCGTRSQTCAPEYICTVNTYICISMSDSRYIPSTRIHAAGASARVLCVTCIKMHSRTFIMCV